MAVPVNATAYQITYQTVFERTFVPGIFNQLTQHGATTKFFRQNKKRRMQGTTMRVEVQAALNSSAVPTMDLMDPVPDPVPNEYTDYYVDFDHVTPANNDFAMLQFTVRTTDWDIWKRSDNFPSGIGDLIQRDIDQALASTKTAFAMMPHLPSTGILGTILGVKLADKTRYTSATAYSGTPSQIFVQLDPVSIGRFWIGQLLDVYTTGGVLRVSKVRVKYVNPAINENALVLTTTTNSVDASDATVTSTAAIAATDVLVLAGGYGVNASGTLDAFFNNGGTYYGRDRLTSFYWALNPLSYDPSSSSTAVNLSLDHLLQAGYQMGWTAGNGMSRTDRVMISARDQFTAASRFANDSTFVMEPAFKSQIGGELVRRFGYDGFVVNTPNTGPIPWAVDDFAVYGKIRFLNADSWENVTPIDDQFMLRKNESGGMWFRNTEDDGSGRPSRISSLHGQIIWATINTAPQKNLEMVGLASPTT
jgi:hypothetical protein